MSKCNRCNQVYTSSMSCPAGRYHPGDTVYNNPCHGCGSCANRSECAPQPFWSCCGARPQEPGCQSGFQLHLAPTVSTLPVIPSWLFRKDR
jgi:hypothetical protein